MLSDKACTKLLKRSSEEPPEALKRITVPVQEDEKLLGRRRRGFGKIQVGRCHAAEGTDRGAVQVSDTATQNLRHPWVVQCSEGLARGSKRDAEETLPQR